MHMSLRDVLRNRDGNALVETAVSLPFLIVLMSGIVDFGCLFMVSNSMQTVASETARLVAIRRLTAAEASTYAQGRLVRVSGVYQVNTSVAAGDVTVSIALPRADAALIDVTGLFSEGSLTASSTMRLIS